MTAEPQERRGQYTISERKGDKKKGRVFTDKKVFKCYFYVFVIL